VPGAVLVCWECRIGSRPVGLIARVGNVRWRPGPEALHGIIAPGAKVTKLAGGFKFVEGPAWDFKNNVLYFSDIPPSHIVRYAAGKVGRRISRAVPGRPGVDVATHYRGKRFNSPNDLWLDAAGGIYFTDPRYGPRENMEQDKEAVYYVAADGSVTRVIDELVRPNGIALSPNGRWLYVVDNAVDMLYRYPVRGPGRLGPGRRIAYVSHPDGMTVDVQGRLYVTSREGIVVLAPDGTWIGVIPVPEVPANCTFGGEDYKTLFITARTSLYAIDTLTRGWHVHLDGPPPMQ